MLKVFGITFVQNAPWQKVWKMCRIYFLFNITLILFVLDYIFSKQFFFNYYALFLFLFLRSVTLPGNGVATFAVSSSGSLTCPGKNHLVNMHLYIHKFIMIL